MGIHLLLKWSHDDHLPPYVENKAKFNNSLKNSINAIKYGWSSQSSNDDFLMESAKDLL